MTTETQNKQVLDFLRTGKTITSLLAFKMMGITRLSARVFDIRNGKVGGKCYNISGERATGKKKFMIYKLNIE